VLGAKRRTAQANSSMQIGQPDITIDFAANRGAPCGLFRIIPRSHSLSCRPSCLNT
jgi:hypothetical protein